jgi:hypothetical protein
MKILGSLFLIAIVSRGHSENITIQSVANYPGYHDRWWGRAAPGATSGIPNCPSPGKRRRASGPATAGTLQQHSSVPTEAASTGSGRRLNLATAGHSRFHLQPWTELVLSFDLNVSLHSDSKLDNFKAKNPAIFRTPVFLFSRDPTLTKDQGNNLPFCDSLRRPRERAPLLQLYTAGAPRHATTAIVGQKARGSLTGPKHDNLARHEHEPSTSITLGCAGLQSQPTVPAQHDTNQAGPTWPMDWHDGPAAQLAHPACE